MLDGLKKSVSFKIAALFPSPYRQVKKRGSFKTNTFMSPFSRSDNCLSSSNKSRKQSLPKIAKILISTAKDFSLEALRVQIIQQYVQ